MGFTDELVIPEVSISPWLAAWVTDGHVATDDHEELLR
jgi:hypothetical protein